MKILLDENLPHQLREALSAHDVSTAQYLGWGGLKSGDLLRVAEAANFDLLITSDQNLSYQQNLQGRSIALLVLTRQKWAILQPHLERIRAATDRAVQGSFELLQCHDPDDRTKSKATNR